MSSQEGNCQKFAASGRSHARDPLGAARATAPEAAATFPGGKPVEVDCSVPRDAEVSAYLRLLHVRQLSF